MGIHIHISFINPIHQPIDPSTNKPIPPQQHTHITMSGQVDTSRLDGKVALVTGSGRGIGSAMAIELAHRGAKVVVNYANSKDTADKLVEEIKKMGSDAISIKADIGNVSETIKMMDQAVEHFGQLDIVCSNS